MPRRLTYAPEEIDAALELYRTRTAEQTAEELYRRGLSPTLRTAAMIRHLVGTYGPVRDRVLEVVRDYRGLPLCFDDLSDELGVARYRVKAVASSLIRAGLLERVDGPAGLALVRDPDAWREAAA